MKPSSWKPACTRQLLTLAACCAAGVLSMGARSDPGFLRYDAVARVVDLTITAGFDKSNSGYNLNGASYGAHRITLPTGWRVRMTFINRDVVPHSAAVVREQRLLPVHISTPAFPGAATRALARGLASGERQDSIEFVLGAPGAYLIACGVPGHTAVGSYLRLTVSAADAVPTYDTGKP